MTWIRTLPVTLAGALVYAGAAFAQVASTPATAAGAMPFEDLLRAVLNDRSPTSANAPERIAAGPWGPVWRAMRAKTAADGLENATIAYAVPGRNADLRLGLVRDVPGTDTRIKADTIDRMVQQQAGSQGARIVALMHTHPTVVTFSENDIAKAAQSASVAILVNPRGVEMLVGQPLNNSDVGIIALLSRTDWRDRYTCSVARANVQGTAREGLSRQYSYSIAAKAHAAHYLLDPTGTVFLRTAIPPQDLNAEIRAYRAGLVDAVRMAVIKRGVDAAIAGLADGSLAPLIKAGLGADGRTFVLSMAKVIGDLEVNGVINDPGTATSRISVFPMFALGTGCDGRTYVKVTMPNQPVRSYLVSLNGDTVQIVQR